MGNPVTACISYSYPINIPREKLREIFNSLMKKRKKVIYFFLNPINLPILHQYCAKSETLGRVIFSLVTDRVLSVIQPKLGDKE